MLLGTHTPEKAAATGEIETKLRKESATVEIQPASLPLENPHSSTNPKQESQPTPWSRPAQKSLPTHPLQDMWSSNSSISTYDSIASQQLARSAFPLTDDPPTGSASSLSLAALTPATPGQGLLLAFQVTDVGDFAGLSLQILVPAGVTWAGEMADFDAQAGLLTLPLDTLEGSLLSEEGLLSWQIEADARGPFDFAATLLAEGKPLADTNLSLSEDGLTVLSAEITQASGLSGRVTLTFPESAASAGLEVRLRQPAQEDLPPEASDWAFEILASDPYSGEELHEFEEPLTLAVDTGCVQAVAEDSEEQAAPPAWCAREERLYLKYFDPDLKGWVKVPSQLDPSKHQLVASLQHLSIFDISLENWQEARLPSLQDWQVEQFTGAAQYSYPLWTPPGPGGLSPQLVLRYNSQQADNVLPQRTQAAWVGLGWSLETGAITLAPGLYGGQYSISAGGVEGPLVQGEDGYYHTLDESFWRIDYDEEKDTWTAWDKQGVQYTFGSTPDSRQRYIKECSGSGGGTTPLVKTLQWELASIRNIYGKKLKFEYTRDSKNIDDPCGPGTPSATIDLHLYPHSIQYPGNPENPYKIYFEIDERDDYRTDWTQDDDQTPYQRFKLIAVHVQNNGQDVRRYDFSYTDQPTLFSNYPWSGGGHTLTLASVQESRPDGASLPPRSFSYDQMHLLQATNGYGGRVEFDYDDLPWQGSQGKPWHAEQADTEHIQSSSQGCTGNSQSWTPVMSGINGGQAYCNAQGQLVVIDQAVWTISAPDPAMFQPGSAYFLQISVQSTTGGDNTFTLGLWDEQRVTVVDTASGQSVVLSGFAALPLDAQYAKLYLSCTSRCQAEGLLGSLHLTRYRVLEKSIYDSATDGEPGLFQYRYDEGAANDTEHSEIWQAGEWYTDMFREFRGHALVQELGPQGRVTSTYYHQDDRLKGLASTSTITTQDFYDDFEGGLNSGEWQGILGGQPGVEPLSGDQALRLEARSGERGLQRLDSSLTDGRLAMGQFRLSGENSAASLYLQSGNLRWGLVSGSDGSLAVQYDLGGGWQPGEQIFTAGGFQRDQWYVFVLGVDDGQFLAQVWQHDQPQLGGLYQRSLSQGQSWVFNLTVTRGTAWLDTYSEGKLYSLEQTYHGVTTFTPDPPIYTGLEIFWIHPTERRWYTFEGDAEFVARRSTYTYPSYDFTSYGNLWRELQAEWDPTQEKWRDYRFSQTRYWPYGGEPYLVGLPGVETHWKCPADSFDGACTSAYPFPGVPPLSQLLSQRPYFYDNNTSYAAMPTQGVLSWKRTLLRYAGANYTDPRYLDQHYTYDLWGNRTTVTSYNSEGTTANLATGSPQTTTFHYEAIYHTYVDWETNAVGHTTNYTYDYDVGLPITMMGPNGDATTVTVEYDDFGRLLKVVHPGDGESNPTMQFSYNDYAYPFRIELWQRIEGSQVAVFERYYNGLGQLIQTQTEDAVLDVGTKDIVADSWYDGYGRVEKQSVPYAVGQQDGYSQPDTGQAATLTSYEILGRTKIITETDGSPTEYTYLDLETQVNDPLNHTTRTINDIWGRAKTVIPPTNNPTIEYTYDALDRLTQVVNAGSFTTSLAYDYTGRKLSMNDPDMGSWSYSYDTMGNLITQTDARGCLITLGYDAINRLRTKTYGGSCSGTVPVTFDYDQRTYGIGQRTGMSDASGTTAWNYDPRGQKISETRTIVESLGTFSTAWSYNSAGQLSSIQYPADNSGGLGEVVNYAYHPQLALTSVSNGGTTWYVKSTSYDSAGRVKSRLLGNNVISNQYSYYPWNNQGGRLSQITSTRTQGQLVLQDLQYEYDLDGNILHIQDHDPLLGNPQTQNFVYDGLHRLTHAEAVNGITANYTEDYQYDATTGNLSLKGASTYNYGPQSGSCPNGALDKAHSAVSAGANSYCYDQNGNMVKRTIGAEVTNLSYDGENRLVGVTGQASAEFIYDGDGNRIISKQNGVNTIYIGNYFEWTGSMSTMKRYYYAGTMRVAMREGSAVPLWLFGDHLGSTSLVANNDGSLNSELRYEAWGETRFTYGTAPTTFRYTGQREESSLGLYYYGARWYDVALSRWIQPDSLIPESTQGVQAWDRYAYVNNSPATYNDPTGHCLPFVMAAVLIVGAIWLTADSTYTPQSPEQMQAVIGTSFAVLTLGLAAQDIALTISSVIPTNSSESAVATTAESTVTDMLDLVYSRYGSSAEAEVIEETGLLRGGDPGTTFFTTDTYATSSDAQQYLSLENPPEVRIDFIIKNSPVINGPSIVKPDWGQPGGGLEYWSDEPIQVLINTIVPLID